MLIAFQKLPGQPPTQKADQRDCNDNSTGDDRQKPE
jgi:hypothetical protein